MLKLHHLVLVLYWTIFPCVYTYDKCKSPEWFNMTMEQLLIKSDIVVLGRDADHGKFRLPLYLDARFDVYCVLKKALYKVPGQVIIEDIRGGDECSGVKDQTIEGQEYIIGLNRQLTGYMAYANINPLQKTAFPATQENLDRLAAACGLDTWVPSETGDQGMCPTPNKPRFCTKIRFGTNAAGHNSLTWSFTALLSLIVGSKLYV